ncbi:Ig-like domain-containing protein [Aeromonas simiae]
MSYLKRAFILLFCLLAALMCGCNNNSSESTEESRLEKIAIVPSPLMTKGASSLTIAKGNAQPFIATGHYSDGTARDVSTSVAWQSSAPSIGTIDTAGLLTGVAVGTTTVTASMEGVSSNAVAVNVTAAIITALQITPANISQAKGVTQPLLAIATYSDNTTADVSSSVTWISSDTATATVTPAGLLTGIAVGTTSVTASMEGVSSNVATVHVTAATMTALQVTPANISLAKGQTQELTAIATYSDNTTADVSGSVTWSSRDTTTATVTSIGLLTGVAVGSTTVTASIDGISSNTAAVNVTAAIITALQVTPANMSLAKGQTQSLTAVAIYSDNTTTDVSNRVTWSSRDTTTATVTPAGLLIAMAEGNTTIMASMEGIGSNTAAVNVTAAIITALQIEPDSVSLAKGQTQQLTAIATYSDNTSANVSDAVAWQRGDSSTATVTPAGLLTGVAMGDTTVTAHIDGISSNTVEINVTAAIITALQIEPESVSVAKGQTQQLTAIATYSDDTRANVSDAVAWQPDNDIVAATVTPDGLLTGVGMGDTTVTAHINGISSNTVEVNVTAAIITALQITPENVSVPKGKTQQLTASTIYSDGTVIEVDNEVHWSSANTTFACQSASKNDQGSASKIDQG